MPSSAGSGTSGSSSAFSGFLIAEGVGGVGNKGSGDTAMVDIQTLLVAFLNMSQDLPVIVIVIYFTFQRSMIGNKTFGYRTSHNTTCNNYIRNTIHNSYININ
jgi:hypothetical protein